MSFLALGVNHHTASVELREQVAFNAERLIALFTKTKQIPTLQDMVVVSTCNRTEVYALTEHPEDVLRWVAQSNSIDENLLLKHVYQYKDLDAMTHLMRVASGLDSLMLGEPQILGQIKTALSLAKDSSMVSSQLHRLFDYAFYAAKKVRSETAVGENAVSMGYAVAQLATEVFSHVSQLTVMIVAAGEMNTLVAKHLAEMGVGKIIVCNRTRVRAEQLAQELSAKVPVEVIDFEALDQNLHRADVISTCTGSLHQIISYDAIKQALKQRKYSPMLVVDLAIPRDVDSKVDQLDGVYLYGIDDLQSVIDENLSQRRQAALDAEVLVSQLAAQFVSQVKVRQAGQQIKHYRAHAEQQREAELKFAQEQLKRGADPAYVMELMSYRLSNKLMHIPSKLFREAAKLEDASHYEWLTDTVDQMILGQRQIKKQS